MAKDDYEFENLQNMPRGKDVSQQNTTTLSNTRANVNKVTTATDKVLYVWGVNWIPRADQSYLGLYIDGTTTNNGLIKELFEPPGPGLYPVVCFKPPLKAHNYVALRGKASTAQNNFRSVIYAFEADQ